MAEDILVSGTEHQPQGEEYLCGPACINMSLSLWDKNQAMDAIWADVQANSGTQTRPPSAPEDEGSFPNQVCDLCADGSFDCWYTTPEAMAKTINMHAPVAVTAEYLTSQLVIERIADSLSAMSPVIPAFTTQPSLHWVVAVGYQLDGFGDFVAWNGRNITGLYVRDPIGPDEWSDTTQFVSIAGLFEPISSSLLMAVECGPKLGSYPVVSKVVGSGTEDPGGGADHGIFGVVNTMWTTFLRFAYRPWRYFMPGRDPRNPKRSPPA